MAVTMCLGEFSRRLRKLPPESWKREAEKAAPFCLRKDCTPGGCRKHCGDYVEAQLHKLNHVPKQTKPPKGNT